MLQVIFKRLTAKNFLSIGEDALEVNFTVGLNIITGKNYDKPNRTNGVGKSTVADALHFGLFGSTVRDIPKDNITNNVTNGKGLITIDFDTIQGNQVDHYHIERTINPSKCSLTKNGEDITRSGVTQTTEFICETIRSTPDLFQNGVIMTVNNTVPFMTQKAADKRKFIEGILNLGAFGDMLKLARQDYNDNKKTLDIESAKIAEVENTIKMLQAQKAVFEADKKRKLIDIAKKNIEWEQELGALTLKLVTIEGSDTLIDTAIKECKANMETVDAAIARIDKTIFTLKHSNSSLINKIKEIDTKKGACKFCSKDIDDLLSAQNEQVKQSHLAEIKKNEEEIQNLVKLDAEQRQVKINIKIETGRLENLLLAYKLKVKENENTQSRIEQIKKWIKLQQDVEKEIQDSKGNYDADLVNLEQRFKDLSEKTIVIKKKLEVIDAAKFIVSEEGVKSILVKKILKVLNTKLIYYLKKMEANCIITFNEYFEDTIFNEKGKSCVYHNFSGAERKAIDLACLFTFMDVRRLQGDLSINVSMYDELLDSSLDEKGIDLVLDILKERVDKQKEAVYIISHRRESVKHVTGDVIFIEMRNGISTRVPFV